MQTHIEVPESSTDHPTDRHPDALVHHLYRDHNHPGLDSHDLDYLDAEHAAAHAPEGEGEALDYDPTDADAPDRPFWTVTTETATGTEVATGYYRTEADALSDLAEGERVAHVQPYPVAPCPASCARLDVHHHPADSQGQPEGTVPGYLRP